MNEKILPFLNKHKDEIHDKLKERLRDGRFLYDSESDNFEEEFEINDIKILSFFEPDSQEEAHKTHIFRAGKLALIHTSFRIAANIGCTYSPIDQVAYNPATKEMESFDADHAVKDINMLIDVAISIDLDDNGEFESIAGFSIRDDAYRNIRFFDKGEYRKRLLRRWWG